MNLVDRLQRWVAIIETISDKRTEMLVAEIRDAIEALKENAMEKRQKQQFTATDREDNRWLVEATFIGAEMYVADLYRRGPQGNHGAEPDWSGYICGKEIDIKAIMAEYLADAKNVADAFWEGEK